MKYDIDNATASAFGAIRDLARLLSDAIDNRQQFSISIEAGGVDSDPVEGYEVQVPDGSFNFHVSISPYQDACPRHAKPGQEESGIVKNSDLVTADSFPNEIH